MRYAAGGRVQAWLHSSQVIVMKSFEDESLSFAIDRFPEMTESSIESFWMDKVEHHRAQRERWFAELEAEYLAEQNQASQARPKSGHTEL